MTNVRTSKKKKRIIAVVAVGVSALTVFLVFFFANLRNAPGFDVGTHTLTVTGAFPEDIPLEGAEVALLTAPLEITGKVNGSQTSKRYQGNFRIAGIDEDVYLNLMDKEKAYIRIVNNGTYYFINRGSERETQNLYEEIINRRQ